MDSTIPYDVVVALNYYAPYVSGVTEAARVTAEGLAEKGWKVLVVAGQHDPSTMRSETIRGVDVVRTPVALRIGKGIVSPSFVPTVVRHARRAHLAHLHLPMLEAGLVAALLPGVPVVATYHCDVTLPGGLFDRFQVAALDVSHRKALSRASAVAVTTQDYAAHSRLRAAMADRIVEIPAPAVDRSGGRPSFRHGDGLHVGFLGRIVEEKGLEYLVEAFRALSDPEARLLIGGDFSNVAGGSVVEKVRSRIGDDRRIHLLGYLTDDQLPDFYSSIDMFAFPSVNSLEAFGLVQVEAMMQGVPVVASDLPGVRVPVQKTGFGRIVPPRDVQALTRALTELARADVDAEAGARLARAEYGAARVIELHDALFRSLCEGSSPRRDRADDEI